MFSDKFFDVLGVGLVSEALKAWDQRLMYVLLVQSHDRVLHVSWHACVHARVRRSHTPEFLRRPSSAAPDGNEIIHARAQKFSAASLGNFR
jgi:hypothetical protein